MSDKDVNIKAAKILVQSLTVDELKDLIESDKNSKVIIAIEQLCREEKAHQKNLIQKINRMVQNKDALKQEIQNPDPSSDILKLIESYFGSEELDASEIFADDKQLNLLSKILEIANYIKSFPAKGVSIHSDSKIKEIGYKLKLFSSENYTRAREEFLSCANEKQAAQYQKQISNLFKDAALMKHLQNGTHFDR